MRGLAIHVITEIRGCGVAAGKVRLATLELAMLVLKSLVLKEDGTSCLRDHHLANLISTKEESMALLRNVFKSEEMFLDMFEDEYREMSVRIEERELSLFG